MFYGNKKKNSDFEFNFQKENPFEKRQEESRNILNNYPGRIPIIVERFPNSTSVPELAKKKFLCPSDITFSQFSESIRKKLKIESTQAIFFFSPDLISNEIVISELYEKKKNADGFLYISYSSENTFG
ncbi:autophagy-related protein 8A-like protein [Neocallimastix lanati (nom. inval.)]|jgi:GABA(A) receptor-associated protein|uniref:Autophagy-related protein n=1 Tax=Neocallimastix californiae TaxID=1754190 RepID=A0A1Y1ZS23_9FUNG|nr:autophagy-related protein 8A-like protein [Neocallimastix sp. JGI-2020a]ORY13000.1 autophagy-related protein 8A-like protein [Neocallimastix californiae]|eukprot:ORY13000.1 autophagy-related protein 8A-like protein [Neocallimastix californiae]